MDLEEAFVAHGVTVRRADEAHRPGHFSVILASESRVILSAVSDYAGDLPTVGEEVALSATHPDAIYRIAAVVQSLETGDHVTLSLQPAGPLERLQRRRNFRLGIRAPLRIKTPTHDLLELVTEDLSAGGLRVFYPQAVRVGTEAILDLDLGEKSGPLRVNAVIVRCRPEADGRFDLGMAFARMRPGDEDRLAQRLLAARRQGG